MPHPQCDTMTSVSMSALTPSISLWQVQALRSAARLAGVPEHVVTGVRLRVKPPSDSTPDGGPETSKRQADPEAGGTAAASEGGSVARRPSTEQAAGQGAAEVSRKEQRTVRQPSEFAVPERELPEQATVSDANNGGGGPRPLQYNLVAVLVHHGGPESGHYTTFRCVGDQRVWYSVSDADVWPVDEGTVLSCEATLLCYEQDMS